MKKRIVLAAGVVASLASGAMAQMWMEVGDADELVPQMAVGAGPLMAIAGSTLPTVDTGVDMYSIRVDNWAMFSASLAGGAAFDTQLFLFTMGGIGIAYNDDASGTQSILPAGNAVYAGRTNGEIVNIAVTGYNRDPQSAGGLIFPNTFTGVFGPTGPGGASPVTGWTGTPARGDYVLTLTGASFVPAPGVLPVLGAGAFLLGRRRR